MNPSGQIRKGSRQTCGYQERHAKVRRKNNTLFQSPTSAIEQLVSSEEDETENEAQHQQMSRKSLVMIGHHPMETLVDSIPHTSRLHV